MIQPQRSRVSSAALRQINAKKPERSSQADDEWQRAAYEYADSIGEVGYTYQLKANLVSRCALQPQKIVDGEWVEDDDERVNRVMAAFVGPYGGQAELKRRAALHIGIAGESYLVGSAAVDEESNESLGIFWEFVSTEEISIGRGGGDVVRRRDGNTADKLSDESYVARLWRSHPRYSDLADSPMKRVGQICRELVLLTQLVEAVTKTRLAANILFVPEEMSFASEDDEEGDLNGEEGTDDGIDPFTKEILEHMSAPVTDRTSAASLVPLVMRGPADLGEKVRVIELARDLDSWAKELREEALDRLAAGLDIPKSTMLGKENLNHWSAYNVDAELVTKHVIPDGELLADFCTYAYLRPMLEEFEGFTPAEASERRLAFDPSTIMARQDEASSARVLHAESPDLISDDALVRANGFDDSDRPDDDEIGRRRMWHLLRTNPSALGPVIGPVLMPELDWSKVAASKGTDVVGPPIIGGSPKDATSGQEEPSYGVLVERLATAADHCLERAFERAGARLVSRCQRDVSLRDRTRSVPKIRACTMVTEAELDRMGLTSEALLAEAWDTLSLKARSWVREYLEATGMDHLSADDRAALSASALCISLDTLAKEHLFRGLPPMRAGLRVSRELIERALVGHTLTVS